MEILFSFISDISSNITNNIGNIGKLLEMRGAFYALLFAVIFYWLYCITITIRLFNSKITARGYFIAGRSLNIWLFVAAATATSFSGWTFSSHPGVIYDYGFSAAFASFYAITIPLSGVFFLKRQWMLGQRCGFVTPGEMFYAYFKSDIMRYLVLIVALLFSILYLVVQLRASGYLFNVLTDGALKEESGTILLSLILMFYVTFGGLRTIAYIDMMQLFLKMAGILLLGVFVLSYMGGINDFFKGIEWLADFQQYFYENPKHFNVPTLDFYPNKEEAIKNTGNYWTITMIFTFLFALMGIQASPAFSMWAFATKDVNAFGHQQVWASSLVVGFILIIFTAIIGIGGHFWGADYSLKKTASFISEKNVIPDEKIVCDGRLKEDASKQLTCDGNLKKINTLVPRNGSLGNSDTLVPLFIRIMLDASPVLLGILAVMALAAVQSTAASYMSTLGSMLSRDLLKNGWCANNMNIKQKITLIIFSILIGFISSVILYLSIGINNIVFLIFLPLLVFIIYRVMSKKYTQDGWQKGMAAFFTILITIIAIKVAITPTDTLVFLGALAVAYGIQMMPALIAICWQPFFTTLGIIVGLCAGLIAVTLTEFTPKIFPFAIGQWPLTIHSAAWGFAVNLGLASLISWLQILLKKDSERNHREKFHRFLNDPFLEHVHSSQPSKKYNWWLILVVVIGWGCIAFGLAGVVSKKLPFIHIFDLTIPSLWIWQIIWWGIGVGIMYWLAFTNHLSTLSPSEKNKTIRPLQLDVSESDDLYCESIYPNFKEGELKHV